MPDSAPNSPTSDPPVGGSDFTVPGIYISNSLTVSRINRVSVHCTLIYYIYRFVICLFASFIWKFLVNYNDALL